MSKKHSAIFDDVLNGLDAEAKPDSRAGARFLARSTRVAERLSGEIEEKTLRWIDPGEARMWDRHNRAYELLTEDNCRDLIDGIRSQGRQEFPAIVRATGEADTPYEVICGARRHFAVSWLRANNYPQFRYLVEVRDLSDEEAFRLADIENRDREDISDYERARDYLDALDRYYGGKQKDMAARLEMSPAYLSRFLQLAKLPPQIVSVFGSVRDIKEAHARALKPALSRQAPREKIIAEARKMQGQGLAPAEVVRLLLKATEPPRTKPTVQTYTAPGGAGTLAVKERGRKTIMEFDNSLSDAVLEGLIRKALSVRKSP